MYTSQISIVLDDTGERGTVDFPARLQEMDGDLEIGDLVSLDRAWVMAGHDGARHWQVAKGLDIAAGNSQGAQLPAFGAGDERWRV